MNYTTLTTYPVDANNHITEEGAETNFTVPTDWLSEEVKPLTVEEFLSEYTFDESHELLKKYSKEEERERIAQRYIVRKYASDFIVFTGVEKRYSKRYGWEYTISYARNGIHMKEKMSQHTYMTL